MHFARIRSRVMKEKIFKFFDIAEFCLGIAFCIALAAIAATHG